MSHEAVAAVTALIELGMIAHDDIVKCLKKALSEPEPQRTAKQSSRTLAWVGLTNDEIDQGLLRSDYAFKTAEAWRAGVVFAMTKLKEKNERLEKNT